MELAEGTELAAQAQSGLLTLEQPATTGRKKRSLKIGVPLEVLNEERRVALSPAGAAVLTAAGHEVLVEAGAGDAAHFSDVQYTAEGAEIAFSRADLYAKSQVIAKVAPPAGDELDLLREKQILISALHLGMMN
ncbi:MAG: alanine dehydrogenase, partial [Bacteroidota bacterium]